MGNLPPLQIDDKEFDKVEAMICSMTLEERRNPKILNGSRLLLLAKGSGTTVQDINKFIKSYEMTQKMMKQMKSVCKEANTGISYRYVGDTSGNVCIIKFNPTEL